MMNDQSVENLLEQLRVMLWGIEPFNNYVMRDMLSEEFGTLNRCDSMLCAQYMA
jgi:hypothetical protein